MKQLNSNINSGKSNFFKKTQNITVCYRLACLKYSRTGIDIPNLVVVEGYPIV